MSCRFWLLVFLISTAAQAQPLQGPAILANRCMSCHNDQAKVAGLDLTTRESAASRLEKIGQRVAAGTMPPGGKLADDEIAAIKTWIADGAKWPETGRLQAAAPRKRAGIDWWALQPLKPGPKEGGIDMLIGAKLREKGLAMRPAADRRTYIRRATFDMLGLPPTPAEVEAFVADTRPDAYEQLVDRLLASPHYGERWGRHWLDVARFGESHGYEQNHLRMNAYPYRDWVIRSLNEDKPFDRMVLEQLAGDQIAPDNPNVAPATGFLVAGVHDTVGNQAIEAALLQRANDLDDIVTAVGAGFLGLTFNCARCHDHKFDPIQQKDYYQLGAVFAGTKFAERPLATRAEIAKAREAEDKLKSEIDAVNKQFDEMRKEAELHLAAAKLNLGKSMRPAVDMRATTETFASVKLKAVRMKILASAQNGNPGLEEIEVFSTAGANVALASKGATVEASSKRISGEGKDHYGPEHLIDGKFGERWFANERKAEVTITFREPAEVNRIVWSRDRLGGNLTATGGTPIEYVFEGLNAASNQWIHLGDSINRLPFDEKARERMFLFAVFDKAQETRWEQLEARKLELEQARAALPKLPNAFIGAFEQPKQPEYVHRGGNPSNRGDLVHAASPSTLRHLLPGFTFDDEAKPEGERRLALAKWIVDPRNALTARVLANRLWHYHFGHGIVGTPSDFGFNGEPPTHPELLDYLANRIHHHGWKLKPVHREILLSRAYRQSSEWDEAASKIDADARLLWRFPPRRLEAEALRDSILAVAGTLDKKMYGPGFQLYRYTVDNVATYLPKEKFGPDTFRRTIYHQAPRSIRIELLSTYDCPDPSLPEPRRVVTTTALQALDMLNNSFLVDQAQALAARIQNEPNRVEAAFALAFGRKPTAQELAASDKLIREQGLFVFCRAIFNANEFVYVM
jgi:hypothetical protein